MYSTTVGNFAYFQFFTILNSTAMNIMRLRLATICFGLMIGSVTSEADICIWIISLFTSLYFISANLSWPKPMTYLKGDVMGSGVRQPMFEL